MFQIASFNPISTGGEEKTWPKPKIEPLSIKIFFSGDQDQYVLKKVYAELLKYNSRLKKSLTLEKLAQSHSCVRSHSDHRNSWQDKKALKNDSGKRKTLSSIIACVNGCREGGHP